MSTRTSAARSACLPAGAASSASSPPPASPDVRAAVERAARDFEAAGARIEPLAPFLTQAIRSAAMRPWPEPPVI